MSQTASELPSSESGASRAADLEDAGAHAPVEGGSNPVGPGARLATAREAHGLSLGDVARQLKLAVRQVEALERDDYDAFPSRVFVRGFMRNYARLLHLDLDRQIAQLGADERAAAPAPAPVPAGNFDRGVRVRSIRWVLAALLLGAIAIALFRPAPDRDAGPASALDAPPGTIQLSAPPGGTTAPAPQPAQSAESDVPGSHSALAPAGASGAEDAAAQPAGAASAPFQSAEDGPAQSGALPASTARQGDVTQAASD